MEIREWQKRNWVSVLAILISLVALFLSFIRCEPLHVDWAGVLVGCLAILVTVLLGWQIYTAININATLTEIDKQKEAIHVESEVKSCLISMSLSDFYYHLLTNKVEDDLVFKYINQKIESLLHASNIGNMDLCNIITKTLLETIPPGSVFLSEYNKKLLFDLLSRVKRTDEIKGYMELVKTLLLLEEK